MPEFGDYFDLLAREIGRAAAHTIELRQDIYERSRHVQSLQLRSFDWASSEEIERERKTLEEAIRKIEELASGQPSIVETWNLLLAPGAVEVSSGPEQLETPVTFSASFFELSKKLGAAALTRIAKCRSVDIAPVSSALLASRRLLWRWTSRMLDD